jgi:hypothetical protein
MESFVVMGAIWAMCAFCAVLFVRGASTPDARRVMRREEARGKALDGATTAR